MKRKVPRKNISVHIADIRKPESGNEYSENLPPVPENWIDEKTADKFLEENAAIKELENGGKFFYIPKKASIKKFFFVILSVFFIIIFLLGAGAYVKWNVLIGYFNSTGGEIANFLNKNNSAGQTASSTNTQKLSVFDIAKTGALWKNIVPIYSGFESFSVSGLGLISELDILGNNFSTFIFHDEGAELINHLGKVREYLESINEASGKLNSLNIGLENFIPGKYGSSLSLNLGFKHLDSFLGALIKWLSSKEDRHILIFFNNSSELRPGGGFIGSYADVVFSGGSVKSIDVRDINDADRKLKAKIIPPKQLQAISKDWTIADSNWFFDYSLSAGKAIELMEKSEMYAGKISFDGAAAVSPKVISDILELTGPIELPGRKIAIDKNNFLKEIQKEVQQAQDKGVSSKKIIAELSPELLLKFDSLGNDKKQEIMKMFVDWTAKKDILIYSKDKDIQGFLDFYGASGKIFETSSDFNGDYLAVVSANIGGGKSDLFVKQNVFFKSQINQDGTASDHLEISREHTAGKNDSWWYRLPNESYLEVFAPSDAILSSFSGGWDRKINPKINYAKNGYQTDELVASVDSTIKKNFSYPVVEEIRQSGKKIFGVWTKTNPGQTTKIIFDYSARLFSPPSDGQKYQFVFEKQSGITGAYNFEIYAPVGFFWKEASSPVFEYQTADPDGRTIFNLTLMKAL